MSHINSAHVQLTKINILAEEGVAVAESLMMMNVIFFWNRLYFYQPSKSVVTTLTVLLSIDLEPKKILGDNSAMQKSSLKGC